MTYTFKVGDRVRVNMESYEIHGAEGVVIGVSIGGFLRVKMTSDISGYMKKGEVWHFIGNEILLVLQEEDEEDLYV